MKYQKIARGVLFLLVLFGLVNGVRLSYHNLTGEGSCPNIGQVPLCYLVMLGYLSMFIGLLARAAFERMLFSGGWALVFLIALVGTGFELVVGDVCPRSVSGFPLCYLSLALCVGIGLLFRLIAKTANPHFS